MVAPTYEAIILLLKSQANPENASGMARYGINSHHTLGISMYTLRDIAKTILKTMLWRWSYGIRAFMKRVS